MLELPSLNSLSDISKTSQEIVKWCKDHPLDDHIYKFLDTEINTKGTYNYYQELLSYVAGSAALSKLLDALDLKSVPWKSSDIDVFLLNQPQDDRVEGSIDMMYCTERNVEELLLNFDLPICRVACNYEGTFWLSIQCLNAIITGCQNLDIHLKDRESFNEILKRHREDNPKYLYERFSDRIYKYQQRGYDVNWIESLKDSNFNWLSRRFSH